MKTRHLRPYVLIATLTLFVTWRVEAGPKVSIATGANPPSLVRFAAGEMAGQLKSLFDAEVAIADTAPADAANVIVLGNPGNNPAIKAALGDTWPKLGEQGHIVKSVEPSGKKVLVVGGDSEVSTMWAAYELGYQYGIRYLVSGDVLPPIRPEFTLAGFDIHLEPVYPVRAWRAFGPEAIGLVSWRGEDHERLVRQLAKLKFNRIVVNESIESPVFVPGTFPIDGETPGRKAFRGATAFFNPTFPNAKNPKERADAVRVLGEFALNTARILQMSRIREGGAGSISSSASESQKLAALPLTDPVLLTLPQMHTQRLHAALAELRSQKQPGFLASCDFTGDLDPAIHFVSRASFDAAMTPEAAYDELFTAMCGRNDVTGRLTLGFKLIEQANDKLAEQHSSLGRALLRGTELLKAPQSQGTLIKEVYDLYFKATNELLRAHGNCHAETRKYLYYYTKRGELAMHTMNCLAALDAAAEAKRKGNQDALVEQMEKAVEALYNALNAQGDVARDQSDRALIAVVTAQGYRPLMKELEKLGEAEK